MHRPERVITINVNQPEVIELVAAALRDAGMGWGKSHKVADRILARMRYYTEQDQKGTESK